MVLVEVVEVVEVEVVEPEAVEVEGMDWVGGYRCLPVQPAPSRPIHFQPVLPLPYPPFHLAGYSLAMVPSCDAI